MTINDFLSVLDVGDVVVNFYDYESGVELILDAVDDISDKEIISWGATFDEADETVHIMIYV